MRRLILLLVAVCGLSLLAACGEGSSENTTDTAADSTTQTSNAATDSAATPNAETEAVQAAALRFCKCAGIIEQTVERGLKERGLSAEAKQEQAAKYAACMKKIEEDFPDREFNGAFGEKVIEAAFERCPERVKLMN